jgi:hypothetical protein
MYYLLMYCLIGFVLLIINSPVSRQINRDVQQFEVGCYGQRLATRKEIPHFKIKLYRVILFILLLFFYPFILYDNFPKKRTVPDEDELVADPFPPSVDTTMLTKRVSVTEAEAAHMVTIENRQVPFGYCFGQWQSLLSRIQDGDELWEFTSCDESWKDLAGREGIVLVRNGKNIYDIITCMS